MEDCYKVLAVIHTHYQSVKGKQEKDGDSTKNFTKFVELVYNKLDYDMKSQVNYWIMDNCKIHNEMQLLYVNIQAINEINEDYTVIYYQEKYYQTTIVKHNSSLVEMPFHQAITQVFYMVV